MSHPHQKDMMLAVKVSLYSNIALFVIKAVSMVVVDSLAIATDLGISCVGLAVSLVLYHAMKMADRPADFFHNYGYGKVENVCELMEGAVLVGLALAMSGQALMRLVNGAEIEAPAVGLVASSLGVAINFWGAAFILRLAAKSASPALKAEGLHFRIEGAISLAITLSFAFYLALDSLGLTDIEAYIDPAATLLVSAIIVLPSVRLLKEAFTKLLDASIGEAGQMDVVKVLARHYDRYCNFRDIRTRTAGRKQFVEVNLILPEHCSLKEAHKVVADVRDDLKTSIAESDVTVHVEPCRKDCAHIRAKGTCPYKS